MSKYNVVKGSGGGKSGGGSARVAQEAPDSLRSKQYARVVDLVSEGEIAGLVDGLKSVYLDNTPIMNADGSYNFQDVSFVTKTGTQSQGVISGFSAVESEIPVTTEVTSGSPIVRTITDNNNDSVRITVSVPALSRQNTSNGDINGTSVSLGIDIQSNGGGYVAAKITTRSISLAVTGSTASSLTSDILTASIGINWEGIASETYQSCTYRVDYRVVGDITWIPLSTGSFNGTGDKRRIDDVTNLYPIVYAGHQVFAPSSSRTIAFTAPFEAAHEFRVVKISGEGTLSINGTATAWSNRITISGKTSGRYQRSHRLLLEGGAPYDIRVTRVTPDSASAALQNKTYWDSYTEIVDAKFTYPNSAIMALSIDSERFNRIPTRGYEIEGMIVQIPDNYNPVDRTYTGAWSGVFTTAYSNNPAWCFYDMIVNDRYGLGDYIDASLVDKWALYEIAQYCDELVSNGLGGLEPRFTFNAYIQDRTEAYNLLEAMSSAFNALAYWAAGSITAVQDSPKDPVALFTSANVVSGIFNYSGSSNKTRHTVALVTYNDPDNQYKQAVEYVADNDGIARYGVIQTDVVAFGCTSRGQAHRFGKAILFSERMETETISFKTGLDGLSVGVGDIIQTSDKVRAGDRLGGRIESATTTTATLDSDVVIDGVSAYTLWLIMPDGTVEDREVITGASTTSSLAVDTAFSDTALSNSIWVLGSTNINPETWRVVSVVESDSVNAEITALEYRSDKYNAIEQDLELDPLKTSSLESSTSAVSDLIASESLYLISQSIVGTRITISWSSGADYFELRYKKDDDNWQAVSTSDNSVDLQPVTAGLYSVEIIAISAIGIRSETSSVSLQVYGLTAPPIDPSGFSMQAISGNAHLTWDRSTDLDVRVGGYMKIRHSSDLVSPSWNNAIDIGGVIAGTNESAVLPLLSGSYLAKWIDSSGNQSENASIITTNAPSIINLNVVETVTEDPLFSGAKTNVAVLNGDLTLDSAETITEQTGNVSTWPRLSALGGISQAGTYVFDGSVDLTNNYTCRLSAQVSMTGVDVLDLISERGLVSAWLSVSGALIDDVSVSLFIRTSDDNVTFGDWLPFTVGDYTARAFEFKAELISDYETHNILVSGLSVTVDMPDRIESGEDIVSGASTKSIAYTSEFVADPSVGITAQDMATGDYYELSNKNKLGFDIIFKNSSGTTISRTFDYIARAY